MFYQIGWLLWLWDIHFMIQKSLHAYRGSRVLTEQLRGFDLGGSL